MDIRQSELYAQYVRSIGWIVEKAGGVNVFIKKVGPFSVIKIQRPVNLDFSELEKIIKKYHPLLVKLEPDLNFKLLRNARILREAHNFQISNFKFA